MHVICVKTNGTNANKCIKKTGRTNGWQIEHILEEADIGNNVLIPIPHVDRGKGDSHNIMSVVHEKTENSHKMLYPAQVLYIKSVQVADSLSDICTEKLISLIRAVKSYSICEGQCFQNVDVMVKTDVYQIVEPEKRSANVQ